MTDRPKHPGSMTDEDRARAAMARRRSEPRGVPILPTFAEVPDEVTGKYEGDELRQMRAKRRTEERLDRLEIKDDRVDERLTKIEVAISAISVNLGRLVDDDTAGRKFRRELWLKVAGGVFSGAVLLWILQRAFGGS